MAKDTFYILTPPDQLPRLRCWDVHPAHLAYRLSPGMRLLRLHGGHQLHGGIMTVTDCPGDLHGDPGLLCMEILRECMFRGFYGVILDLERPLPILSQFVSRLAPLLSRQRIRLFLPECYASLAPSAHILISSALSGGSLSQRLTETRERFGAKRVVLAVERRAEVFQLPCPTGCGTPLSSEDLEQLKHEAAPTVFFSRPLCANYFIHREGAEGLHFVLFDDIDTMLCKLETARQSGIHAFLLPWAEVCPAPERFCLPSGDKPESPSHFSPKN